MGLHEQLDTAWAELPVLGRVGRFEVRDLRPLVDSADLAWWLGDLGNAAWGHLADCGWEDALGRGGEARDAAGALRSEWVAAFEDAVDRLAGEGRRAGPEGDPERWAGWLALEFRGPWREG